MTVPRFGVLRVIIMSTLLLSILGLSMGVHQYCAVWREISPCTCRVEWKQISITCEKMNSFGEVVALLQDKFTTKDRVILKIAYSNLEDLSQRSFKELNMTIQNLKLHHDDLSELTPYTFSGLTSVRYLSLADNPIPYMPIQVFEMMPNIKTLDIGRLRLKNLPEESFKSLPQLETLVLPANMLFRMDTRAIPPTVTKLHLGRNSIRDLNGTLKHLTELQWLFLNGNDLVTLDDELPRNNLKIVMLHAGNNRIQNLPQELKTFPNLDKLFFQSNLLTGLDGALSKSRRLDQVNFEDNRISTLLPDDFAETEYLQVLELQHNLITSLNSSLLPLRKLRLLNLTHNLLTEFSWKEIKGLKDLRALDLSFNKINHLTGLMPNLVEWETKLNFLKLDHNELYSLNGALSGLRSLLRLNLSFNSLTRISPDDLIGLDQLTMLDISHNKLTTLEETSKTFMPALEELIASHNYLTVLDKDFHGLPVLCWADLSHNQIVALGRDLVSKTHCRIHDGVHEANWGTLKIYLEDNPIMCDAAFPEINSAMEVNHTKIIGVTYCPPLSELPVTSRPSAYFGHLPDSTPPIPLEPLYPKDLNYMNQQDLNYPRPNIVPIHENHQAIRHNHGLQYQERILDAGAFKNAVRLGQGHIPINDAQPIIPNDPFKRSSDEQHNIDAKINYAPVLTPINDNQPIHLNDPFKRTNHVQTKLTITELPLNDQPIYTNIDPIVQEQQISQLASEIEELKTRVEELTSQNQRLAQNLHNIFPNQGDPFFENRHRLLPLDQIILPSTEKTTEDVFAN